MEEKVYNSYQGIKGWFPELQTKLMEEYKLKKSFEFLWGDIQIKEITLLIHSLEELNDIQAITTDYRNGFPILINNYDKEANVLYVKKFEGDYEIDTWEYDHKDDFDKIDESLKYLIIRGVGGEYDSNIYSLANRKQIEFKTLIVK
jgi:hypothetical protein